MKLYEKAKSRKYIGIFGLHNPVIKIGQGLVSTSRTYASPKWDGTRSQEEWASSVGMPHPSQIPYGNYHLIYNVVMTCFFARPINTDDFGMYILVYSLYQSYEYLQDP